MTKPWRIIVCAVGVLSLTAVGLSVYTLSTLKHRVSTELTARSGDLQGPRGETGPPGPPGLPGAPGAPGADALPGTTNVNCKLNIIDWEAFESDIEQAIKRATQQAIDAATQNANSYALPSSYINTLLPPGIGCSSF